MGKNKVVCEKKCQSKKTSFEMFYELVPIDHRIICCMITVQRWRQGYLAKLGGGFPAILQHIGGAKRAPPDMQRTLYLSNYFGTK